MTTPSHDPYRSVNQIEIDIDPVHESHGVPGRYGTIALTVVLLFTGIAAVLMRVFYDKSMVYLLVSAVSGAIGIQTIVTVFCPSVFDTHFILKGVMLCGIIVLSFSFPSNFPYHLYEKIATIAGIIYLMIQQLLLLDFAYSWNQNWVARSETGNRLIRGVIAGTELESAINSPWLVALLFFSVFYGACFVATMSVLYTYFSGSDCTDNRVIITTTLFLMLAALICQLRGSNGSVLTSGIVSFYAAYLCYSTLTLNPDESCNPLLHSSRVYFHTTALSTAILVTLLSTAWLAVVTTRRLSAGLSEGAVQRSLLAISTGKSNDDNSCLGWLCGKLCSFCTSSGNIEGQNSECESGSTKYTSVHVAIVNAGFVFFLIPLYFSMTLTDWGQSGGDQRTNSPQMGRESMWMQGAALWACIGMYLVSLLVPQFRVFPRSIWDLQPRIV
mmetsp:Transcript_10085/g.15279  ORF Transcript_10085/g.15279 Transcript_10085/m.15279 type:complete len:442 (+) Transcript_10085:131-1456(+)